MSNCLQTITQSKFINRRNCAVVEKSILLCSR